MKKIIIALLVFSAITVNAAENAEVNEKVLRSFKETFTNVKNAVWQSVENEYRVNFWQGDMNVRATYDEQGNLLRTIRYYSEKQLPPVVMSRIKKRYAGREIFGVTEVATNAEVAFFIKLRDDKNWYTVQADVYGNSEQVERFKRADTE